MPIKYGGEIDQAWDNFWKGGTVTRPRNGVDDHLVGGIKTVEVKG
jgi:hypothetical protein